MSMVSFLFKWVRIAFLLIMTVLMFVVSREGNAYAGQRIEDLDFQGVRDRYEFTIRRLLRSAEATVKDKQRAYNELEGLRDRMKKLQDEVSSSAEPTYMELILQPMIKERLEEIENDLRQFVQYQTNNPPAAELSDFTAVTGQPVSETQNGALEESRTEDIEEEKINQSPVYRSKEQIKARLREISIQMLEANRRKDYETRERLIYEHRRLASQLHSDDTAVNQPAAVEAGRGTELNPAVGDTPLGQYQMTPVAAEMLQSPYQFFPTSSFMPMDGNIPLGQYQMSPVAVDMLQSPYQFFPTSSFPPTEDGTADTVIETEIDSEENLNHYGLKEIDDDTAEELGIDDDGLRPMIDSEGRLFY